MNTQELLTLCAIAIVAGFCFLMAFDFISGLINLWRTCRRCTQATTAPTTSTELIPTELPTATADDKSTKVFSLPEINAADDELTEAFSLPTMPHTKLSTEQELLSQLVETISPKSDRLLENIDIDRLPLRTARKIAKALSIPQKLNGKDKPVAWLRGQIKKRLAEQPQTTVQAINEALQAS